MTQQTVAVYYPAFMGGGAEAVGLWMLEALKDRYAVTLFTVTPVDFARLNIMYGTHLTAADVTVKALFPEFTQSLCYALIANSPDARILIFHLLLRFFKAHSQDYDLVISGFNATDLGKVGLQYIHWIKVLEGKPIHQRISNFSEVNLKANLSVANSQTVADAVQKEYGITAKVIYPPVVIDVVSKPWAEKENAFICSGRLTKTKQPHQVIQILKQVRDQGFDIKLYMTGGGDGIYEWRYQQFIKRLVAENSDWVTLYEGLKYQDYVDLLSRCRYGIHYKQEPFGISIAEMVKAGALPFVRSKGGQVEIVGSQNEALLFRKAPEAADKIVAVLSNPELQAQLCQALEQQKQLFSTQRFMAEISHVVADYLANPSQVQ